MEKGFDVISEVLPVQTLKEAVELVEAVERIAETTQLLSRDTAEQALAMEQATDGVARISEVVQSNSAASEESSATS